MALWLRACCSLLLVALSSRGGLAELDARAEGSRGRRTLAAVQRPLFGIRRQRSSMNLAPDSYDFDTLELATSGKSMFLHIPKTGGTSVEEYLNAPRRKIPVPKYIYSTRFGGVGHKHKCHQAFQNMGKHWTIEQIERCQGEPNPYRNKTVFCFLRDPVDRVVSELAYRKMICEKYCKPNERGTLWDHGHFGRAPMGSSYEFELLTFANAVAFYVENLERDKIGSSRLTRFTDHLVHVQPQNWYVFDQKGHQTCEKVKLMEDLGIPGKKRNSAPSKPLDPKLRERLKGILWNAYKDDFLLVDQLRALKDSTQVAGKDVQGNQGHLL